jgi:hypothetical protein
VNKGMQVLAVVALVAATACGNGGSSRPSSTGSIEITQPTRGEVVEGPSVTVKVALEGATLLEEASRNIRPDTGHMHITLDGTVITLLAGLEYTIETVEPGTHVLQAEFVAADHGPFDPPVIETVSFRVA